MGKLENKESVFFSLMAVFLFILYFCSLKAGFLFDDNHMIVSNTLIKNIKYFGSFFTGSISNAGIAQGMCRPLLMLTFGFNYLTCGLNPAGYHIVNIILHFLNAVLLYILLKTLFKNAPQGLLFILTGLFLAHPLNSEAVTYISCRSDLLAAFFILSSFILYLKGRNFYSCLLYIPALLTKETALCLPLLIVAHDLIYNAKTFRQKKGKPAVFFYCGLVLITVFYIIYKNTLFAPPPGIAENRSVLSNIFIQSAVAVLYLKLFFAPVGLNISHYIPKLTALFDPISLFSVTAVLAILILAVLLIKKNPSAAFGLSWLLIGLSPKFYARLAFPACEHHFYLPGIGLYLLLAVIFSTAYIKQKKYFLYISAGILLILSTLTWFRIYEYIDPFIFWKTAAQRNPYSGAIHNNLGLEYLKAGKDKEAFSEFTKAAPLAENKLTLGISDLNLGYIYLRHNDYPGAINMFKNSIISNGYPPEEAYLNIGTALAQMGREDKAITAWQEEIRYYPGSSEAFLNLGITYLRKNDLARSEIFFKEASRIEPDNYAPYYGLAQIYEKSAGFGQAKKMYLKAITLEPLDAASHYELALIYLKENDQRALFELKTVMGLQPKFSQAYYQAAVFYSSANPPDWKAARQYLEKAVSLGYKVDDGLAKRIRNNTGN